MRPNDDVRVRELKCAFTVSLTTLGWCCYNGQLCSDDLFDLRKYVEKEVPAQLDIFILGLSNCLLPPRVVERVNGYLVGEIVDEI
jgi:hypothetical protein